jgi:hypothetical protein
MISPPGGVPVHIETFFEGRLPGFYYINVTPMDMYTWKHGVYIFAVAVDKGSEKGQALASVMMD